MDLPGYERLGWPARGLALGIALAGLAMLAAGAWLDPSGRGVGTHEQLGMQPCGLLQRTGVPCPTCGMTTAVSHLAHGQVLRSLYAQPMGALVGVAAGMAFWGGLYIALTGRPAQRLLRLVPGRYYVQSLLAVAVLAWAWKIWAVAV